MAVSKSTTEITILEVKQGKIDVFIVGNTPLICNRMSQKVLHELLLPARKKNAAEKQSALKHNPLEEYRASPYRMRSGDSEIGILSTAFKNAIRSAALDIPGASKSQIGRLVYVEGEMISIFGVPQLFMSVTRSADINRTPDIRTRAILPEWACKITVAFTEPMLRHTTITNLIAAAGYSIGVGDWRPEKGSGTYGQFRLVAPDDPDYLRITSTQGREAQRAALDKPECYDEETAEMFDWFGAEAKRRGFVLADAA